VEPTESFTLSTPVSVLHKNVVLEGAAIVEPGAGLRILAGVGGETTRDA
jgi:hypothetical protein